MRASSRTTPRVAPLTGERLRAALPELARLRIRVFREWPYLYHGDPAYERDYLTAYAESRDALVAGAFDGDRLVGAATAAPMEDHAAEFAAPFEAAGFRPEETLYCGESVLEPAWRGRGVGHAFFDAREAHGRALGRRWSCFCAVRRDSTDPRRPESYRPLDSFWRRRGYERIAGAVARFEWREVGAETRSAHEMDFWLKPLTET